MQLEKRLEKVTAVNVREVMTSKGWMSRYEIDQFFEKGVKNANFLGPVIRRMYDRGELLRFTDYHVNSSVICKKKVFFYRINEAWRAQRVTKVAV